MIVKTLLVPISGNEHSAHALDVALLFARSTMAHVTALHVRADPRDVIPLIGEGVSASMVEELMAATTRDADRRAEAARAVFDAALGKAGVPLVDPSPAPGEVSASFVEEIGRVSEVVGRMGRLTDIVVITKPDEESLLDEAETLNAALFETGKPVLVVPPVPVSSIGQRLAIAWDGSTEAARAVSAALPLIEQADKAVILSVGDSDGGINGVGPLAEYLEWHGSDPEINVINGKGRSVSATLLGACKKVDGDLLVMGAYGHSRMRELIMGGVTRDVLADAEVPVLMVH